MSSTPNPSPAHSRLIPNQTPAIGFVSTPTPGRTWTWTTRLGVLLSAAENAYGPRDKNWTILGVEFGDATPHVWYPTGGPMLVVVRLSLLAASSPTAAFAELAHEVVHLLAPTGSAAATRFEEGLATLFSEAQCAAMGSPCAITSANYSAARDAVKAMIAKDPTGVINMRKQQPNFTAWTAAYMAPHFPHTSTKDLDWISETFDY